MKKIIIDGAWEHKAPVFDKNIICPMGKAALSTFGFDFRSENIEEYKKWGGGVNFWTDGAGGDRRLITPPKKVFFLGFYWEIKEGDWGNGGTCLNIFTRREDKHQVGISLLKYGQGKYASAQRAPKLFWCECDYKAILSNFVYSIRAMGDCGRFSPVCVRPIEDFVFPKAENWKDPLIVKI